MAVAQRSTTACARFLSTARQPILNPPHAAWPWPIAAPLLVRGSCGSVQATDIKPTSRSMAVAHRSTTACARFLWVCAGLAPLRCSATCPHTRVRDAHSPSLGPTDTPSLCCACAPCGLVGPCCVCGWPSAVLVGALGRWVAPAALVPLWEWGEPAPAAAAGRGCWL